MWVQRAKKVVSDNLGLVDFAIEPVSAVLNMFNGQVKGFLRNSNYIHVRTVKSIKNFGGYLK